jgi:hypothetical protein
MVGVSLAILLGPTALAHADEIDDDFVDTLAQHQITGDPVQLVSVAHTVCSSASGPSGQGTALPGAQGIKLPGGLTANLPGGLTSVVPGGANTLLPLGNVMSSLKLPMRRATFFVNTAISTYCPQLLGPQT